MTFLLYIYIMWISSIGFLTADSEISARVGSTVILPCEWRDVHLQIPHVQWNTVSETVFERKGVEMYVGEGYQGRVDVPQDKLLKGNCSLVLKNVTLTDAGVYESYLSVRRMKRSSSTKWVLVQWLKLSVDENQLETSSASETPLQDLSERLNTTDDVGVNRPRLVVILFYLLSCFLMIGFCV